MVDETEKFPDFLNKSGDESELTVGLTAIEGKAGATRLLGRQYIIFMALDSGLYYGFNASVSTSTGIPIYKSQLLMIPIGPDLPIYFIASAAGKKVRFQEVG